MSRWRRHRLLDRSGAETTLTEPADNPNAEADANADAKPVLPPFDASRFERQLAVDTAARWVVGLVAAGAMLYLLLFGFASIEAAVGLLVLVGAWLVIVGISAKATQELAPITMATSTVGMTGFTSSISSSWS